VPYKMVRGEIYNLVKELNELEEQGYSCTAVSGRVGTGGDFYVLVHKPLEVQKDLLSMDQDFIARFMQEHKALLGDLEKVPGDYLETQSLFPELANYKPNLETGTEGAKIEDLPILETRKPWWKRLFK
jgi:hypothetical protein